MCVNRPVVVVFREGGGAFTGSNESDEEEEKSSEAKNSVAIHQIGFLFRSMQTNWLPTLMCFC